MSTRGKVIVAMSGGVDSSVAAYLLKQQGYDCIGVFLRVGVDGSQTDSHEPAGDDVAKTPKRRLKHGCCSVVDALDARAVAARLDIPLYVLNAREDFEPIIEYFVDEYSQARTPNPCVMCNIHLKFGKLMHYADAMGADFVATGHYARVLRDGGDARLARAVNVAKDQSYVLFGIRRENIARCLLPIGEIENKSQVRKIAEQLDLRVHDKPDSQEICFVPNGDYREVLDHRRPGARRQGDILDRAGRKVGTHRGAASYTIGQRHGLGIALGQPAYVVNLDVVSNTVTVGSRDELLSDSLTAQRVNWLVDEPPAGRKLDAWVKIRHMHTPARAKVLLTYDGGADVRFSEPQSAITPGQAAVFYDDAGIMLGGGWIASKLVSAANVRGAQHA